MTPQKKQRRKNHDTQHQQTVQPQSATNDLAHTNDELNLKVLRSLYPQVQTILHVAPYAVLYNFSANQQWEKSGVEGTLFIVHQQPDHTHHKLGVILERFSVIILNRRGLDNFAADLHAPEEIEATEQFIILSGSGDGEAGHGLWIFSEPPPSSTAHMREATAAVMTECARRVADSRQALETARMEEQFEQVEEVEAQIPSLKDVGRQVSLLELFGKQREMDAGFSVHDHHSARQQVEQKIVEEPKVEEKPVQPLFKPSKDTEFFRTSSTPIKKPAASASKPAPVSIAVEDLFRSAKSG